MSSVIHRKWYFDLNHSMELPLRHACKMSGYDTSGVILTVGLHVVMLVRHAVDVKDLEGGQTIPAGTSALLG